MATKVKIKKYPKGGKVPQYGNGATIGSILGAGVGALGFMAGPQVGLATTQAGLQIGSRLGGGFDEEPVEEPVDEQLVNTRVVKSLGENLSAYAMGGQIMNAPNAEIEKQEVIRTPNGQTMIANAPSHEQGGIQLSLPPGTEITSDRLKNPLTGNTFAKDQASLERSKARAQRVLKNRPKDKYALKSAEILDKASQAMFDIQEMTKMQENAKNIYKMGGIVKYDGGGGVPGPVSYDSGFVKPYDNSFNFPFTSEYNYNDSYMNDLNLPIGGKYSNKLNDEYNTQAKKDLNSNNGLEPNILGLALPMVSDAIQTVGSFNKEPIQRIRNEQFTPSINRMNSAVNNQRNLNYNVNDMVADTKESEGAMNTYINRNISNGGARMGNRLANRSLTLNRLNQVYGERNRANIGIQTQANQMDMGVAEQMANLGYQDAVFNQNNRDMNLQQKANLRGIRNQAMANSGKNAQMFMRDKELLKLLPLMYPNVSFK